MPVVGEVDKTTHNVPRHACRRKPRWRRLNRRQCLQHAGKPLSCFAHFSACALLQFRGRVTAISVWCVTSGGLFGIVLNKRGHATKRLCAAHETKTLPFLRVLLDVACSHAVIGLWSGCSPSRLIPHVGSLTVRICGTLNLRTLSCRRLPLGVGMESKRVQSGAWPYGTRWFWGGAVECCNP
jgi:hypothetical protein